MNARQFSAWARPRLLGPDSPARSLFLSLPGRWTRALGPGRAEHFLESSVSSAAAGSLKLALILGLSPRELASRPWRDDASKGRAGERWLREANADCATRYDVAALEEARDLLGRWRLRGSLMISCDFLPAESSFGKATFYGYADGDRAVDALIGALSPGADGGARGRQSGSFEFWGLDLWPDGRRALKLYHRRPYARDAVPQAHRALAAALETVASVRDLTTLTRCGAAAGAAKVYLGLAQGVEAGRLRGLPATPETRRFLSELARSAEGQRVYFFGFDGDGALEAYFDRRKPDHEEKGPIDDL